MIGALLATRNAQAVPTKARWFGRRYLAQSPPGVHRLLIVIPWMMAVMAALVATSPKIKNAEAAVVGSLLVGFLITPFFIGAAGKHFLFDDEGIEAISPWRRKRFLLYRDIVRVRRSAEHEGYVVKSSKGVVLYIRDNLSGGVTLAAKILKHLPEDARVSKAARAKLLAAAVIEKE